MLLGFVFLGCGPESSVIASGGTTHGSSSGVGPTTTGSSTTSTTSTASTSTTSTTADADTSTTEPDNEFETGSFIPVDPKGGGSIECDVWAQDCQASHKCQAWANDGGASWNATLCALVDKAPVGLGEPCLTPFGPLCGIDTCDHDTMCWNVDPSTEQGVCVARCGGTENAPVCDDGFACFVANDGTIQVCLPPCSARAPACPDGSTCTHSSLGGFACVPTSLVATQLGAPCETAIVGCGAGLLCTHGGDVPGCTDDVCCTALCDTESPSSCADAAQVCAPLDDESGVGACGVPS